MKLNKIFSNEIDFQGFEKKNNNQDFGFNERSFILILIIETLEIKQNKIHCIIFEKLRINYLIKMQNCQSSNFWHFTQTIADFI